MTHLYVNGSDIRRLAVGFAKEGEILAVDFFDVGPEEYLSTIDAFLRAQGSDLDELTGVVAARGPGSATALRSSLSIVNTIVFAREMPIIPVQKTDDEQDVDSFKKALANFADQSNTNFIYPKYSSGPKITFSTRDALKRKKKKV